MTGKDKIKKIVSSLSIFSNIAGSVEIDNEEKSRRKLFSVFLIMLIIPVLTFGILNTMNNHPEYGIPNFIITAIMILMLFNMNNIKNAIFLYRTMAFFALLMFIYWIAFGVGNGYASLWLIAYAPFVFFLLGKKEGTVWVIVLTAAGLMIFLGLIPYIQTYRYSVSYIIRLMSTFAMVVLFTYYYETVREIYKESMDSDRKQLLDERNLLAAANEETKQTNILLKKEMEERRIAQDEIRRHRDNLEEIVASRTEEIHKKNRALTAALDELEKTNFDLLESKDSLSESEIRYRLLADNVTDLIWSTDLSLKFMYLSPSIKNIYGYTVEEGLALTFEKWSTPESYQKAIKIFADQLAIEAAGGSDPDRFIVVELEQIRKDGSVFPVELKVSFLRDVNKKPIGTVGITRDITERIKSQKEKENIQSQLSQAQKMEAIGTLVGGLAHDFNNVLGGIIGSFDLIKLFIDKEKLVHRDEIVGYISLGMESSKRSVNLIKQLLTLSKKRSLALTTVDINQSLKHILVICKNSFPKNIILDFRIDDGSLYILAEAVQIEQVLLNLCINASHAMTIMRRENEPQGGILTVTACVITPDTKLKRKQPEASSFSRMVRVSVKDTGIGMKPDVIHRIFEPFFTTKKQEEGTGLGLSISYSIVKQHRGFIDVESEQGKGSTFSIYLPADESGIEEAAADKKPAMFVKGSGTILIIDDELFIVNVVRGILTDCGYDVLSAGTPDEGISIYSQRHAEISAVILDLSMPGRSGLSVFSELKKINPSVKAVLASGMLENDMKEKASGMGISFFLNKPFNGEELSSTIEKIINS